MSSTPYKDIATLKEAKPHFNWPVVISLFLLLAIPSVPAIFIVTSVVIGLGTGQLPLAFVNDFYLTQPLPVIVHGLSGIVFFVTAPMQFSSAIRIRYRKLHKISGYFVFLAGYAMALSGVWMHQVLSPEELGPRYIGLILMALAMCCSFTLALKFIIQGNVMAHQVWVIRAIAITLGAVTYLFVELVVSLTLGQIDGFKAMLAQWLFQYGRITAIILNLIIAQWIIKQLKSIGK